MNKNTIGSHTPGPWTCYPDTDSDSYETGYARVGTPDHDNPEAGWLSDYFHIEDARLIAAAPDLLAVLKRSLSWLSSYPGDGALDVYDEARAAIAKAEGR
jgi:hypothetical protein